VLPIPKATVYGTEAIEIGIGATVAAVVVLLFVRIADGYAEPVTDGSGVRTAEEVRDD
jgi:hypothetical protein